VIVIERIRQSFVEFRMTIAAVDARLSAERLFGGIPLHVIDDEQVQAAIVIVIEPPGRHSPPARIAHARLDCDVLESAIAAVAVQGGAIYTSYVEIGESIVVEISGGCGHTVAFAVQTGLGGDILEG